MIRSVEDVATGVLTSGPCRCVDLILEIFEESSIANLVEKYGVDGKSDAFRLARIERTADVVKCSPRVGLSLKVLKQKRREEK